MLSISCSSGCRACGLRYLEFAAASVPDGTMCRPEWCDADLSDRLQTFSGCTDRWLNHWELFDNSGFEPLVVAEGGPDETRIIDPAKARLLAPWFGGTKK